MPKCKHQNKECPLSDNKSSMKSLMAYEKIRNMILKGQKLPGTRLIIADLEKELGIGKGPIREALMRLDRSGLVKNIPYKGVEVATTPTPREILYIYQLRKDLESNVAVAALENITDSDICDLEELHQTMLASPEDNFFIIWISSSITLFTVWPIFRICTISPRPIFSQWRVS